MALPDGVYRLFGAIIYRPRPARNQQMAIHFSSDSTCSVGAHYCTIWQMDTFFVSFFCHVFCKIKSLISASNQGFHHIGALFFDLFLGASLRVWLSLLPSASLRASVLSLAHTATQPPPHHSPTPHSKLLHHSSLSTANCQLLTANCKLSTANFFIFLHCPLQTAN